MRYGKGHVPAIGPLLLGGAILAVLTVTALLAPAITDHDPLVQNLPASLSAPGEQWTFGTDSLGRDVFSRVVYGSRVSLAVGFGVLLLAAFIGTVLGTVAGYCGAVVDAVIMRIADVFMSFPPLVLAMIAMTLVGPGPVNLFIILAFIRWPQFARLVRGQVMHAKSRSYVDAARVSGTRPGRLVVRHILPNCYAPVLAYGTMSIGGIIIDEAALSFLGLGIQAPQPSWGVMLADAHNYLDTAPWLVIFPGMALAITVLGCNLLGDGLGYLLNPKQDKQIGAVYGNFKSK